MDETESKVLRILKGWGFSVERLPESSSSGQQVCDFDVNDSEGRFLIEVKTRGDDPSEEERRVETLSRDEVFESRPIFLTPNNADSKIFRNAASQLSSMAGAADFRIVWICPVGRARDAKAMRIESTLYGTADLVNVGSRDPMRACYFFHESEFFGLSDQLDAVVISIEGYNRICLNPLSPRYEALRKSVLVKKFGDDVCDPEEEVSRGDAYLIRESIDRKDKNAMMEFLKKKSGKLGLMKLDLAHREASIRGPTSDSE